MFVNHSGWSIEHGSFNYDVFVDENRRDYAVYFKNGKVAHQTSSFQEVTGDWNYDGDVYSLFGAWFDVCNPDGSSNSGVFYTPEELVSFAISAKEPDRFSDGQEVLRVDGICVPDRDKRPTLQDRLVQTEKRAMHQEAERNRKMAALGIRNPNEPWAR